MTEEQFHIHLEQFLHFMGSHRRAAQTIGISEDDLVVFLNGNDTPATIIARHFGLVPVVTYKPVKE